MNHTELVTLWKECPPHIREQCFPHTHPLQEKWYCPEYIINPWIARLVLLGLMVEWSKDKCEIGSVPESDSWVVFIFDENRKIVEDFNGPDLLACLVGASKWLRERAGNVIN